MIILPTLHELPKDRSFVLGIGFFDGCHLGHQAVFDEVKRLAKEKGALPGILTFYPHPMQVLAPEIHVPLLQSASEKLERLSSAGMALAVCITPRTDFLSLSADDFLEELSRLPGLAGVVTGENFSFGHGGMGKSADMKHFFAGSRVTVRIVPLQAMGDMQISSTAIRQAILGGEMEKAARLLGRDYTIKGDVVHGFRRGHDVLGFPTANLSVSEDRVLPPDGVYATRALVKGHTFPAITNIGNNPTFGNEKKTIETFIFDFDESIYGASFTLAWVSRIRGEMKFASPDLLVAQIHQDIQKAKKRLHV